MVDTLINMSLTGKISLIVAAGLIIIALYLRYRDNAGNNFKKAREHHKKAIELHGQGREDDANKHYQAANEFREKAEEQT